MKVLENLAQLVRNHVKKLDKLEEAIKENAENLLGAIDLDELLIDPEGYLLALGDAFLKEHLKEIQKASDEGKKFARNVINET